MKAEEANRNMSISHKVKKDDHRTSETAQPYDENINKLIEKQASSALLYLLFFSILMFTLPFGSFFGTQYLLKTYTDFSEFAITAISVSSSVITVYLIIFLYAFIAYKEKEIVIPDNSKKSN